MVRGINVEITIRDNKTGAYLRIPVVPPTIRYNDGEKKATTVDILNLGAVDFPAGVELDAIEWGSFFPARYDPGYCNHSELLQPLQYRNRFSSWKDGDASLQLIIPAAGINKEMYLKSFTWELRGFEGDIYYHLGFKEVKRIRPQQVPVTVAGDGTIQANPKGQESRPPVPDKPKPATYTVQRGDTLTAIAKKVPVKPNWRTLYENNKDVIGANPNRIFPGQVLKV